MTQRVTLVVFLVLEDDNLDIGLQTSDREVSLNLSPEQRERARDLIVEVLEASRDGGADRPGGVGADDAQGDDGNN